MYTLFLLTKDTPIFPPFWFSKELANVELAGKLNHLLPTLGDFWADISAGLTLRRYADFHCDAVRNDQRVLLERIIRERISVAHSKKCTQHIVDWLEFANRPLYERNLKNFDKWRQISGRDCLFAIEQYRENLLQIRTLVNKNDEFKEWGEKNQLTILYQSSKDFSLSRMSCETQ